LKKNPKRSVARGKWDKIKKAFDRYPEMRDDDSESCMRMQPPKVHNPFATGNILNKYL